MEEFNDKEWHGEDIAHYGKPIVWKEIKFRFKATEGGKIVGSMSGKIEAGVVYIEALMTGKEARKKGVGRALMKKVDEFAKKNGAHKLWLITGSDWEANAFYQKLGYEKAGELPRHHFKHDFVIYSKYV